MVKKIIDLIFPVAALPKNQETRSTVINNYEKLCRKTPSIWSIPLCLLICLLFVTQAFSVYSPTILIWMIIPTLLFAISAGLLLKFRIDSKSTHKNMLGLLLFSYGFILCYAILFYWIFNINSITINMYIAILIISFMAYYIGYWCWLKDFNKRIATTKVNKSTAVIGAICGCIGYLVAKHITNDFFIFISVFLMITFAFALSASLVDYRQYDNIQRAKNGQPFK